MRHLMLALMFVLLPLRGWMGDAMATGMAAGQLSVAQATQNKVLIAPENIADNDHGYWAGSHIHSKNAPSQGLNQPEAVAEAPTAHDCGTLAVDLAGSAESSGTDCGSCPSCQACHTVALTPVAEKSVAHFNVAALPQAATLPFASADAALSQKPPIS